jgi:hypothetical protein
MRGEGKMMGESESVKKIMMKGAGRRRRREREEEKEQKLKEQAQRHCTYVCH